MDELERMVDDVLARYGVVPVRATSVSVQRENEQFALRQGSLVRAILTGVPEQEQSLGSAESPGLESAA